MGSPEDFGNFVSAVIDERSFDKIQGLLDAFLNESDEVEVIAGGAADKSTGYFCPTYDRGHL